MGYISYYFLRITLGRYSWYLIQFCLLVMIQSKIWYILVPSPKGNLAPRYEIAFSAKLRLLQGLGSQKTKLTLKTKQLFFRKIGPLRVKVKIWVLCQFGSLFPFRSPWGFRQNCTLNYPKFCRICVLIYLCLCGGNCDSVVVTPFWRNSKNIGDLMRLVALL